MDTPETENRAKRVQRKRQSRLNHNNTAEKNKIRQSMTRPKEGAVVVKKPRLEGQKHSSGKTEISLSLEDRMRYLAGKKGWGLSVKKR